MQRGPKATRQARRTTTKYDDHETDESRPDTEGSERPNDNDGNDGDSDSGDRGRAWRDGIEVSEKKTKTKKRTNNTVAESQ